MHFECLKWIAQLFKLRRRELKMMKFRTLYKFKCLASIKLLMRKWHVLLRVFPRSFSVFLYLEVGTNWGLLKFVVSNWWWDSLCPCLPVITSKWVKESAQLSKLSCCFKDPKMYTGGLFKTSVSMKLNMYGWLSNSCIGDCSQDSGCEAETFIRRSGLPAVTYYSRWQSWNRL